MLNEFYVSVNFSLCVDKQCWNKHKETRVVFCSLCLSVVCYLSMLGSIYATIIRTELSSYKNVHVSISFFDMMLVSGAMNQHTKSLACGWAKDCINSNCVAPEYTKTTMVDKMTKILWIRWLLGSS